MQQTNVGGVAHSHVPADLVVDFDMYQSIAPGQDVHLTWARLFKEKPLIWTPANGGHWIAARGDIVRDVLGNHDLFSNHRATIPNTETPALPLESDPPDHTGYRAIISPLFAPDTLRKAEAKGRAVAIALIDGFKADGHCEFIAQFARHVPVTVFLSLLDLKVDQREYLVSLADRRTRSPSAPDREAAKREIFGFMVDAVESRRRNPGDDFISKILHAQMPDRPLREDELYNLLATNLAGGLDSIASSIGFAMMQLAQRPDLQARLIDEPGIGARAVDEFLRRSGINNTSRVVKCDMVYQGVELRAGDQICAPSCLVGLDDSVFPDPLTIDFDRPDASRHGAFGNGIHRCPGANLARLELRFLLTEWLARIPRFRLNPDHPPCAVSGVSLGMQSLHLVWEV